ncbi:ankyrin-2-like isoform X4 [Atheta coriaria]|uniref:ankyrin-2-like isoform X4 n=1 Tax=Dalotia coriaria TaxID=877792 RepID=UPI0031F3B2AA
MAQFVTHIQPTLVEASHHHTPGHSHGHHKELHHPPKEHHSKGDKDHRDHGDGHHHGGGGHGRDFPVLPSHHSLHFTEHHDAGKHDSQHAHNGHGTHSGGSHSTHKRHSQDKGRGHYLDSHGISHEYQMHFIDAQGIHRDQHGHGIIEPSFEETIPSKSKPQPPKYIDIQPVYTENKHSDGNTSFLRAARAGHLDKVLEHLKQNIDINTSNANGLNALHLASKDGHTEVVAELLKRGAAVDAATKKGNTALHIASLAGQEEVVKLLVNHGAKVNVQSQNGFTPLYMAAQENHDNVVRYLLSNGANQTLATEDGFTPLAVAMQQGHDKVVTVLLENDTRGKVRLPALHIAAKKDDVKAAKLLLENDHNPDVTSKSGFTPLHIASHYGNEAIAHLLIQKKADVNYAAKHNITPLHVAAKWGKTNMVALLLEKGATIESKTRDGLTPMHCAARSGHEQVVDMLLEREAPISCKTKNGLAPLHMAAQGDHVDAARILLYHRAPVDEVTVDYLTALHVAAHCGHVRVAKLLLDRQADSNARALNGFTPLHIACKKNRIKVVELLLKHGASISATTESGLTPLHVASFMGCMNIVIYLLQHDANPDVPTVRGETPLHLAARANQTDIIRILLRNGAQVDARAREQQTPLHIASRLGNVDIVMLLLQHGAKVDTTTKDMYTALHIAAKEGQDEVAGILIDNGASLNAITKKGFTPLHLAAKYGNIKVAKLLLQKDAPVDPQGKNGVTPLHVASHYDHQNVALLLLDKGASPHATAKNGHTPLHIAAKKNQMDIANTLLEYGAKPNAESKAGFTPLHLSAQEGHVDMSSLLIEHEADTNSQAKNGLTPLHLCAQEDRVAVADVLVKNKAIVDKTTKAGYTPLHVASHYGQNNMVKFLLAHNADVKSTTQLGYTPLHQAAQQGHTNVVTVLLENSAQPNAITHNGQTPLHIAQKLGYITVIDTLKVVTESPADDPTEEKYKVVAPEAMHETFMSDSEEEGGEEILEGFGCAPHEQHVYLPYYSGTTLLTREDTMLGDNAYRYLTADEMKSLGDDSLPIDVTRDERMDSNKIMDSNMLPPQAIEDSISPHYYQQNYSEMKKYTPDNIDIARHPINIGFLVSFLVDARGGAMRGCRHSGVRVIVPPRSAGSPTRITCRYVRPQRSPHPPPLMEGEALASRVLELGPVGARFLGPVIIEVPHFAALRGKEREIVILRSDNGETWREHTVESSEDILNEVLQSSFEAEDISQLEDTASGRITRIVTHDFPQYFAVVSRIRQEVHAIGPDGGMVSSTVVPQVQAVFPQGALTKKIKVGLQAQPIDPELTAKLLGHGVAVSPVVTVEPRRRKFHKAITLSMPAPRAHSQGMINQYSGSTPTLRLLCSITGGTTRAQWEDVTGSTPLTFVNDCVSFTTTVSARFWLMDCRNVGDATKMATELYREAIHVPFMAKFVVFAKRVDPLEARLRVFCMTDDKEDKTLEHQEHFSEVAKSRDVEVLEGKPQYIEFAGNLVPITKSGEQLQFAFRAFRENRLPFSVRVKDQHAEALGRCLFMREPKVAKGEPPQQPVCILNIVLPDDIVADTISLTDSEHFKRHEFLKDSYEYHRPDPRLADMSNLLGDDWVALAGQLGLTSSEINVIKSEYPESVAKQAQSMLRMWISQSSNRAQSSVLEDALRKIGRDDIIPQCLNVEETVVKYRIRSDLEDKDIMKDSESIESIVIKDKKRLSYDKYSAEEKVVEEKSDEEDFSKTVKEKREIIEKRLSVDRTIPASSQRVEIVQEISSIKRQSMVEDKIAEVEQKATMQPPSESKSTTEEVKTTKSSVADATKDERDAGVTATTTTTTTTVTETRTIEVTGSTHIKDNDSKESVLVEGVTHGLEKKTAIPKIVSAQEDPQSPKLSKTPPPSPADFILREQMAALQEWDEPKEKALATELQGKQTTTSTTQNFEDRRTLDDKELASKQLVDKTNAFNEVDTQLDASAAEIKENGEELKQKKPGFFGALKTMVTRSFDYSDSESEKSQSKKEKKDKKKKKKRGKDKDDKPESPVKVQPLTIEEERLKTIPYAEASPVLEQKAFIVAENIVTEVKKVPAEVVAKEEKLVEKKTIVPVVELIEELETKIYDTPEFHIEVKPLTPTKEKVIYDVDIHSTIDSIGKELLKDDTITDKPPRISETDVYDDQAPQLSIPPDHVSHLIEEPDNDALKMITFNLIQNEMSFQGWADDKHNIINITKSQQPAPASQKMKRKHGKLFGFLSKKSSKEVEDSDDDTRTDQSRSEIIEKQDKESSKEIVDDSSTSEQNKKGGFFTIFGKKNKKEDDAIPESSEVDEDKTKTDSRPPKILISEPTRLDINNSDSFIKQEVTHYEDVRPVIPADKTQVTAVPEEESKTDRKSGIFSGIFGKKKDDIDTEKDEKAKTPTPDEVVEKITEKVDKTVEVTKKELHDVKETITETTLVEKIDKPIDASEKRKGGVYTDIFIKNEIQSESQNITQHEKVTVTTETVTKTIEENGKHEFAEEVEKDDQGEKKKSGIFSGIFSKKDKRDSDEPKVKSPIFGKKDTKPEAPKEDKKDQEDGKETVKEVIQTTEVVMRRSKQKDAQADEKPDQKEEEKEKRRSGIFSGIFGKKDKGKDSEDEKTDDEDVSTKTKKSTPIFGKKEKTPPAKIILSNELVTTMKDTESFLQEEVSRYEDVKPLVKPIAESEVADAKPAAQQEEEKEKRKSGIFSGIFGKKEKPKEGEEEKPDEQDSPAKPKMTLRDKHLPMNADVPDEVLERLKNANLISKKEVPVFEDSNGGVRHEDEVDDSAVKAETETLPEIIADVSEKDKRKAGIFSGIFGKKDKATENEEEKDVKSPTKQKKMTPIFGKKDKSKPTEIKLSEEVVTTMITTESFLQEEVARFEDVIPLPKKEREPEVVDEKSVKSPETEAKRKSGLFSGIFSKRDKSRDKEDVKSDEDDVAVDKQKDTPVEIVSDEVEKIVQEVKSTVEQIEVHVDEKPFDVQPETQPDDKEKRRSGIFSGIFGKKDKGKESEDEKTDDEETVSKTKKHTPIFGKKDKKTTTTAVISDDVVNSMKTTEAFLQEEVARFEDVKPVVTATTELEVVDKSKEEAKEVQPDEEKEKRKSGIFSGIFGKKDKGKESEDEKTDDEEAVSKQKKQTPIFGKKEKKTPEKTQLSEEAKQVIKDSDAFLQEEVSRYDDVKPVITEKIEIVEEVEEKPKEKSDEDKEKRKSGIFSGLFGKKDKGKESEDEKTDDEEITTKTKKQTSIFTKKEKKPPTKVELPEDVVKDMKETDNFLQEEVARYEDVKLIKSEEPEIEKEEIKIEVKLETDADNEKDKRKSGLFSGIFGKKDKSSKESEDEKTDDEETITKTKKRTPIFGKKEKKTPTKIELSENVVKDMKTTDSFLQEEVKNYEDVKPLPVKQLESETIEVKVETTESVKTVVAEATEKVDLMKTKQDVQSDEEKEKRKSGIFSGLFGKKDKGKESEDEKTDDEEVTSKAKKHTPIFGKKDKKTPTAVVISEDVLTSMKTTESFLKEEVERFEDVKPVIAEITEPAIEIKTKQDDKPDDDKEKRKSGIFSGIFGKKDKGKESEDEKTDDEETISKSKKRTPIFGKKDKKTPAAVVISEDVLTSMKMTETFLQEEVDRFEDVKPVIAEITETAPETKTKLDDKPEDDKEKRKSGIFSGIFGKKDKGKESEDEKTDDEEAVSKQKKQTPIFGKKEKKTPTKVDLSEDTIIKMKATDSFLVKEVDVYEDVRPVITEKIEITESVTLKSPTYVSGDKDKTKSGIFSGIFVKKDKGNKESEDEKTDDESTSKSKKSKLFGKKEDKAPTKVVLSEEIKRTLKETDSFLQDEVANYEDVKPVVQPTETVDVRVTSPTPIEDDKEIKRKSGLFGGIFGKRKK